MWRSSARAHRDHRARRIAEGRVRGTVGHRAIACVCSASAEERRAERERKNPDERMCAHRVASTRAPACRPHERCQGDSIPVRAAVVPTSSSPSAARASPERHPTGRTEPMPRLAGAARVREAVRAGAARVRTAVQRIAVHRTADHRTPSLPSRACRPSSKRERPRSATRRFPSTIGPRRAAPRSVVLDRPANPTRPDPPPARRTPIALPERTAAAFQMEVWSGPAGVHTTRAPLTRTVRRGRRAFAVARLPTTSRIRAPPREAIAPSTPTADKALIARPRGRAADRIPTIATPDWTRASTTRTALPPTGARAPMTAALMTPRSSTGRAGSSSVAHRDPDLPRTCALRPSPRTRATCARA